MRTEVLYQGSNRALKGLKGLKRLYKKLESCKTKERADNQPQNLAEFVCLLLQFVLLLLYGDDIK